MLGDRIEQNRRKTYLNIKNGAVVKRTDKGEESYSYVEGRLEAITQKERIFRNESVIYWYIDLRDRESGELYSIGSPYGSNTFKSIVLALASKVGLDVIKEGGSIRIDPYTKKGFDKVVVWADGTQLDWVVKTLPPVDEAMIGGRKIKDDSKRMEFISSLVEQIRASIPIFVNR